MDLAELPDYAREFDHAAPQDILAFALETWGTATGSAIALSFSGAEDVVLVDMLCKLQDSPQIFTLDTGRLHAESYQFIEKVRSHYGVTINVLFPDSAAVQTLVAEKGLYSFYQDGHQECCAIRKIAPLRAHLAGLDAWITGQRRDQSPTRTNVPTLQLDRAFSSAEHPVVKVNPLANWTSDQVWQYIRSEGVPYNRLHDKGYKSIGCEPCSKAVNPGEHERAGRWWWEESTKKECGLHASNLTEPAASGPQPVAASSTVASPLIARG